MEKSEGKRMIGEETLSTQYETIQVLQEEEEAMNDRTTRVNESQQMISRLFDVSLKLVRHRADNVLRMKDVRLIDHPPGSPYARMPRDRIHANITLKFPRYWMLFEIWAKNADVYVAVSTRDDQSQYIAFLPHDYKIVRSVEKATLPKIEQIKKYLILLTV